MLWENWISTCIRMKLDFFLTPYTEINQKWIIDLNVRVKTITLLEENIGVNLHNLGFGNGFLEVTPKAQEKKKKQIHWTSSKLKFFVFQRTPSIMKRQPTKWEKYLQVIYLIWDLYLECIKSSQNSTMKRQVIQLKLGKGSEQTFL